MSVPNQSHMIGKARVVINLVNFVQGDDDRSIATQTVYCVRDVFVSHLG
jgi:hypothetical protein